MKSYGICLSQSDLFYLYTNFIIYFFILIYIFFYFRERAWAGERGRGRKRISSMPHAQHRAWHKSWIPRSWPEPKSRVGHSTDWATHAPLTYKHILNTFWTNMIFAHIIKQCMLYIIFTFKLYAYIALVVRAVDRSLPPFLFVWSTISVVTTHRSISRVKLPYLTMA